MYSTTELHAQISSGHVSSHVGGQLSATVTVKEQLTAVPSTVQVTMVGPTGNTLPEAGKQVAVPPLTIGSG
jgi:hypothetical protein